MVVIMWLLWLMIINNGGPIRSFIYLQLILLKMQPYDFQANVNEKTIYVLHRYM